MAPTKLAELSKEELYQRARKAGVPGRSQMGKSQLVKALSTDSDGDSRSRGKKKTPGKPGDVKPSKTGKRAVWKGAITFGLISIPIGLYTAIEDRDISFRLLSGKDGSRIQYKRVSSKSGREVEWDDIVKGYEYTKGHYVTFTQEELERIPSDSLRAVDVVQFADQAEIDPLYFDRPYFVAPEPTGLKAYQLLRKALEDSGRVGIAKVTLREKERLCVLRVRDDVLVLETMNWPDEIRIPDFEQLDKTARVSAEELKMAKTLVDQLTAEFDPSAFEDTYRQRLEEAIEAKIEGEEVVLAPEQPEPGKVVDLMEALRASVEEGRSRRSA
jgi:DNA end-binding protein Ku